MLIGRAGVHGRDTILQEGVEADGRSDLLAVGFKGRSQVHVAQARGQGQVRRRLPLVLDVVLLLERAIVVGGHHARALSDECIVLHQVLGA